MAHGTTSTWVNRVGHPRGWIAYTIQDRLQGMPFNGLGFSGGGFGQAQGPGGLGATTSQATGVAAYGSVWASSNCPSCNTTIINMQTQLIRVASLLGATASMPTGADGRVGAGTVGTLMAVAQAASARGLAWGVGLGMYGSAELVARNADKILSVLSSVTSVVGGPTTPTPSVPGTNAGQVVTYTPMPGSTSVVPTTTTTFPPGAGATRSKIPVPYLVGGGILFVGIAVAAYILMSPSKSAA